MTTTFQLVSKMNTAFGNPKGDPTAIDINRLRKQVLNIGDEFVETLVALGADKEELKELMQKVKNTAVKSFEYNGTKTVDLIQARDGLCDVQVFAAGGQHFMGVDGDADMQAVIDGVMTRFVKDDEDLQQTLKKHSDAGITSFYLEGEFPTMIVKSSVDQPDAPKGKFLKSASYQDTLFPVVEGLAIK